MVQLIKKKDKAKSNIYLTLTKEEMEKIDQSYRRFIRTNDYISRSGFVRVMAMKAVEENNASE